MKTPFKACMPALAAAVISIAPLSALAVETTDFSKPQMKEWAIEYNQMQECLTQIDEMAVLQYDQTLNHLQNQLDALCQAGKTDEAQHAARAFKHTVEASTVYQQIQACGAKLREHGFMPPLPEATTDNTQAGEQICGRFVR
ncbi:MAG: hypothetical protein IE920_02170 [Thiotrichales bacterium]|nr:hypothetical protein [Thiotrichales bacterium]